MSIERPGELNRLVSAAEAISSLHEVFATEEPLDEVLDRVAQAARRAIPDADGVSVTVLDDSGAWTAASTDEEVLELDGEQYAGNAGPCLHAARSRQPVRVTMSDEDSRWPRFTAAARRRGVSATLSMPLLVGTRDGDPELVGSLNVYSRSVGAFDPFDEELLRIYNVIADAAVTTSRRWQLARDTTDNLERALTSRAVIDQAKGALQAIHGCSAEEAFDRLVRKSQHSNVKVHTVARELLDSLRTR
jgi:AmiR/NasT family two-component response regulator